jgi:hypothetical protein
MMDGRCRRGLRAAGIALLALAGGLGGCAGSGGGGTPKPACKPPAGGVTISYSQNIQPIYNRSCALAGCHTGPVAAGSLDLTAGKSYRQTVNVPSSQQPKLKRIAPGNPTNSYLVRKIGGAPGTSFSGVLMPQGCPGTPLNGAQCLSADDIAAIVQWVTECAPNN